MESKCVIMTCLSAVVMCRCCRRGGRQLSIQNDKGVDMYGLRYCSVLFYVKGSRIREAVVRARMEEQKSGSFWPMSSWKFTQLIVELPNKRKVNLLPKTVTH
jgi:hypothetical protein